MPNDPASAAPAEVGRDPFAVPELSPRGRRVLVGAAVAAAIAAAIGGLAPLAGPIGMFLGLSAHLKGSRFGMPATVLAGVATVVGFAITFLLR